MKFSMGVEGTLGHVLKGLVFPKLPCCRRLRHCLPPRDDWLFYSTSCGAQCTYILPLECDTHSVGNLIMHPPKAHLSTSASSCYTLFTQPHHSHTFLNRAQQNQLIQKFPLLAKCSTLLYGIPNNTRDQPA